MTFFYVTLERMEFPRTHFFFNLIHYNIKFIVYNDKIIAIYNEARKMKKCTYNYKKKDT